VGILVAVGIRGRRHRHRHHQRRGAARTRERLVEGQRDVGGRRAGQAGDQRPPEGQVEELAQRLEAFHRLDTRHPGNRAHHQPLGEIDLDGGRGRLDDHPPGGTDRRQQAQQPPGPGSLQGRLEAFLFGRSAPELALVVADLEEGAGEELEGGDEPVELGPGDHQERRPAEPPVPAQPFQHLGGGVGEDVRVEDHRVRIELPGRAEARPMAVDHHHRNLEIFEILGEGEGPIGLVVHQEETQPRQRLGVAGEGDVLPRQAAERSVDGSHVPKHFYPARAGIARVSATETRFRPLPFAR